MSRDDLFQELETLARSLAKLLPELPPLRDDWRPREGMRTVWELARHLVQVPAIDTLIARSASQEEVRALETRLARDTAPLLLEVYRAGVADARAHFGGLDDVSFETTPARAFYGHTMPPKGWLLEIVTHTYHHRAMLHTYLKILGRPVDMSYLYT